MIKNLVIVESPAKVNTIKKILGKDFTIKSSIGHVRNMPKKNIGIDIDNNFKPTYIINDDKTKIVNSLKKLAKNSQKIYLATDDDREGEAIAWHLLNVLDLAEDTPRIVFHEITKNAILSALDSPRTINTALVDAQQARRIIDRLVGFEISPILWRKISGARSAGRVQSPVVRLIVEREREIENHIVSSVFKINAILHTNNKEELKVKLNKDLANNKEATKFAQAVISAKLTVIKISSKPSKRSPQPPFITSTLQQEASQKLNFTIKQTMIIAQNLYRQGFITYMRTDSLTISQIAINAAEKIIKAKYGDKYHKTRIYKNKNSNAQEAHEAIRPTDLTKNTITTTDENEIKLYELIYKRTLESQMSDALFQKNQINISVANKDEFFIAEGERLLFAGFLDIYNYTSSNEKNLAKVDKNEILTLKTFSAKETFIAAKARYTEASLVKKIEKMGIGRPSTFASIISTVQDRSYAIKENRKGDIRQCQLIEIKNNNITNSLINEVVGGEKNKLFPTSVAYLLTDFLVANFANIVNYEFSSNLENDFDAIARGQITWQKIVKIFYTPFHKQIKEISEMSTEQIYPVRQLGIDPKTNKPISVRFGRYGGFVQIGDKENDEKPLSASLKNGQNIQTISLEEALELFKMPRVVGETADGTIIKANYGRFGPYIQYGNKYVSLKEDLPENIGVEKSIQLITTKEKQDANRVIKEFNNSKIQILNGRFGPYICNGKKKGKGQKNITIKKIFGTKEPKNLSFEECKLAINNKLPVNKTKKKKKLANNIK